MPEGALFLTIDEALGAVSRAFAQYPSQMNLLSAIWPMVFGGRSYVLQDAGNRSAWAKIQGKPKLIPTSEEDLKQLIVGQLKRLPPDTENLARICSRVFGAYVQAGSGPEPDLLPGIWVDTDMEGFVCRQCGRCCRTLNYHDGCTVADFQNWRDTGRTDILAWVGTIKKAGVVTACQIWMVPGTNRYADDCPWLKKSETPGRTICTIHDIRPTICRQYPGSRKHARMTGCRGV